jgi:hypothetical protein
MHSSSSWSILNAKCLFDDKNIKVELVGREWSNSTTYIVENEAGKRKMLSSCGSLGFKVGDSNPTHADQSGRPMGMVKVVNIVSFEDGKIVKTENDIGLDKSMPIYVFK